MASESVERLQKDFGALTQAEAGILKDMIGFLEYAIRNELPFAVAVATLGHDVNGLARYGFDLNAARHDDFQPKVAGYSQNTADSVGEPDEERT